jgi:hypothetical protein
MICCLLIFEEKEISEDLEDWIVFAPRTLKVLELRSTVREDQLDRSLACGLHQGQRSHVQDKQTGQMTATHKD